MGLSVGGCGCCHVYVYIRNLLHLETREAILDGVGPTRCRASNKQPMFIGTQIMYPYLLIPTSSFIKKELP